jgi:hypothetical protein
LSDENHFVPQFYLRRFSDDGSSIKLLNLMQAKIVPAASIAGQCKKHKLYAFNPETEGALGKLEGDAAGILRRIDETSELPSVSSKESDALKFFLLMQKVRTVGAGRVANEMTDYFGKIYFPEGADIEKEGLKWSNSKIVEKFPNALSMEIVAENAHLISDFDLHLFMNRTDLEFITSDNPAVAHNLYCEGINHRGVMGVGCSGYQLILPISPHMLIMMYDHEVYSIGPTRRSQVSNLMKRSEIETLNSFQMLNAEHNVYFRDEKTGLASLTRLEALRRKRELKRLVFVSTKPIDEGDGKSSSIIHHFERLLPLSMKLDEIGIRRRKRSIPLDLRPREKLDRRRIDADRRSSSWKTYSVDTIETR